MTKHKKIEIVYLTRWFINQAIQEGFRSFMLCAYEIIEYYYSVAKPYCRKKAITYIVFQQNKYSSDIKPDIGHNSSKNNVHLQQ